MASASADRFAAASSSQEGRQAGQWPQNAATASSSSAMPAIFELQAPAWRPRLHPGSHALGWPDVYPPKPGQVEDVLSESAVKNGVGGRSAVSNETYSAHDMIYDRLKGTQVTLQLGQLFHEVAQRRKQLAQLRCGPAASHYRPPQRVTLNEAKLAAYIRDLADPDVPLRKIARSVPHGYRGDRMLDMFWNGGSAAPVVAAARGHQQASTSSPATPSTPAAGAQTEKTSNGLPSSIAIDRAVWFVRVVGASEISSSRTRQGSTTAYTAEWTNLYYNWLRKQIVELHIIYPHATLADSASPHPHMTKQAGPSTPRANTFSSSAPSRENPYSLFLDDDFRFRWLAKWDYSISLLRAITQEGLIDLYVAAKASLELLRHANRVQICFALVLIRETLAVTASYAVLAHQAVEILCDKIRDLDSLIESGPALALLRSDLESTLAHLYECQPDAFVSLSQWQRASSLLQARQMISVKSRKYRELQARNQLLKDGLLQSQREKTENVPKEQRQLADIALLDGMCVTNDIPATASVLFPQDGTRADFKDTVTLVLVWATTDWRYGSHRAFAAASLLSLACQRRKHTRSNERGDLDSAIFSFLCETDSAMRSQHQESHSTEEHAVLASTSVAQLVTLLGELCRRQCFSFPKYLQRLVARGLTATNPQKAETLSNGYANGHSEPSKGDTLHAKLLRSIPITMATPAIEAQRRTAIYGNRTKESWEEAMLRRAHREVLHAMQWLQSAPGSEDGHEDYGKALGKGEEVSRLDRFWSSSSFIRKRVIRSLVEPCIRDKDWQRAQLSPSRLLSLANLLGRAEELALLHALLVDVISDKAQPEALRRTARDLADSYRVFWTALVERNPVTFSVDSSGEDVRPAEDTSRALPAPDAKKVKEALEAPSPGPGSDPTFDASALMRATKSESGCSSLFDACLDIIAEAGEDGESRILLRLMRAFPSPAVSPALSNAVSKRLVGITSSVSSTQIYLVTKVLLELGLVSFGDMLTIIVGVVTEKPIARAAEYACVLSCVLDIALFMMRSEIHDTLSSIRIRASRSSFITLESCKGLIRLAHRLFELEESNDEALLSAKERLKDLRHAICTLSEVRILFQGQFIELLKDVFATLHKDAAVQILEDLLPCGGVVGAPPDTEAETCIQNYDIWHHNNSIARLAITLQDLDRRRTSGEGDLDNIVLRIAKTTNEHIIADKRASASTLVSLLSDILTSASRTFISALVDENVKKLNRVMTSPSVDMDAATELLRGFVRLLDCVYGPSLPVTSSCASTFDLLLSWFESSTTSLTETDGNGSAFASKDLDAVYTYCGIICAVMRMENTLATPTAKSQMPRLYVCILRWAIALANRPEIHEADITPILDAAQNLLFSSNNEVQMAAISASQELVASMHPQSCTFEAISKRLIQLCTSNTIKSGYLDSPSESRSVFVETSNHAAAFLKGQYTPQLMKPWEWHPNVDMMKGEVDDHAVQSMTELGNLPNNGPLSLSLFSAHKTLDRLPRGSSRIRGGTFSVEQGEQDPAAQSLRLQSASEASFGLHLGGESVFSRDIVEGHGFPRGLGDTDADPPQQTIDPDNLSHEQMRQFVPALRTSLETTDQIKRQEEEAKAAWDRRRDELQIDKRTKAWKRKQQEALAAKERSGTSGHDNSAAEGKFSLDAASTNGSPAKKRKGSSAQDAAGKTTKTKTPGRKETGPSATGRKRSRKS